MKSNCYGQALISKAKGIYGNGITQDEYNELIHKKTVADVATYLKNNTRYKFVLDEIKGNNVHRGQLEAMVRKNIFYEYVKLLHFVPNGEDEFFDFPKKEAEIEQILSKLRYLKSGDKQLYISELPVFMSEHLDFDIFELANADDVKGVLAVLRKTQYYKVLLKTFEEQQTADIDYISYERALYSYFYQSICNTIKKIYAGETRQFLLRFFADRRDMQNIVSTLRLKNYYNLGNDDIQKLLLSSDKEGTKSKMQKQLKNVLLAKTQREMLLAIGSQDLDDKALAENVTQLEKEFDLQAYKVCKKQIAFSGNAAVVYTAFLFLTKTETDNIITIIEGIRYGMAPEKIKTMLRM